MIGDTFTMFRFIGILSKLFLLFYTFTFVWGHGMVLEPPNRSSRWRFNDSAPVNFEDNQLFCGGSSVQWYENGGKCGLCGDNWADPQPRPNELGGIYGDGTIVSTYMKSGVLPVSVLITANHKGYFYFKLCDIDRATESNSCFDEYPLRMTNGSILYFVPDSIVGFFNVTLQLPKTLTCAHCVLQWTYRTGNSWGICSDGSGAIGCGQQEHFRTCSDISIISTNEAGPENTEAAMKTMADNIPIDMEIID